MQLTPLIYDILTAVIIVFGIVKGVKDGFVKTAVMAIGYAAAVVAALVISNVCTSLIYTGAVEPMIASGIETSVANAASSEVIVNEIMKAVEELPAISGFFFDFEGAAEQLAENMALDSASIAAAVCETVIRPIVEPILETFIFMASLILLTAAVNIIAKGSKVFNEVPVIGKANAFFGGAAGFVSGIIKICAGALIIGFAISAGIFPEYFSKEIVSDTYLFKWAYSAVSLI